MVDHTTGFAVLLERLESGAATLVGSDASFIQYLRQSFDELQEFRNRDINRLERKFDPTGWQWEQKGQVYQLEDLSREDLIQVACEEMEAMERVDSMSAQLAHLCQKWRNGDIHSNPAKEED